MAAGNHPGEGTGADEYIKKYINDLGIDIVSNIDKFKEKDEDNRQNPMSMLGIIAPKNQEKFFDKYKVQSIFNSLHLFLVLLYNSSNSLLILLVSLLII